MFAEVQANVCCGVARVTEVGPVARLIRRANAKLVGSTIDAMVCEGRRNGPGQPVGPEAVQQVAALHVEDGQAGSRISARPVDHERSTCNDQRRGDGDRGRAGIQFERVYRAGRGDAGKTCGQELYLIGDTIAEYWCCTKRLDGLTAVVTRQRGVQPTAPTCTPVRRQPVAPARQVKPGYAVLSRHR